MPLTEAAIRSQAELLGWDLSPTRMEDVIELLEHGLQLVDRDV